MIKTLTNVLKQDKEKFAVPRKVQDIIPVRSIWTDGVFMTGKNKFSKMWRQGRTSSARCGGSRTSIMLSHQETIKPGCSSATLNS